MAEDGLHDLLAGHWRFRRHASTGERMQGEASFLPGPDGLRYHEEGVAILPGGQRFSFFRNYVYRIEGAGMTILFDGPSHGVFQQVALTRDGGGWAGQGHHPCGQDIYRTAYRIAPGALEITHRVIGPNKDYVLETVYDRADVA